MTYNDAGTGTSGLLRISATEVSTDIAANTSLVSWELRLYEIVSSPSYNNNPIGSSVTVDGSVVSAPNFTFDWRPAGLQEQVIASGSTTVAHGADGKKTLTVTGHINATLTSGAGGPTDVSVTFALTDLFRLGFIGTGAANKRVTAAFIGTAGGNKRVLQGWIGTSGGNKRVI